MAFDAEEVVVGAFGHIYVAAGGTSLPTTIAAAITAMADTATWKELGYIDENGVTPTFGKTVTPIQAWQAQDPIRQIINARTGSLAFALMQINSDTLPFAMGGGVWTPGTGDSFVYEFPTAADPIDERAMLLDVEDGDTQIVFAFYRATVSGDTATQFVRNSAGKLPVTVDFLADPNAGNIGRIVGVQALGS